jgi:outer membrane protein assembly factor BamB
MGTPLHDVFISYNRKDKSFVEFLVRCLERAGLKCFQDTTGLKVFDKLDASLKAAISQSRWLMAIISPSYLQSYWCLFEAMEAIEGQDFEQRFLPIALRYKPEDQTLDETFVLKALRDLDEQIKDFENQLISLKAYDLAPKLQKLNFVRQNLPGVFRQIYERIFPEFMLWDDDAVRQTLRQITAQLAPEAAVDFEALPLDFRRLGATPLVVPRLRELPTVLWRARVGRQLWRNSPVVVGRNVIVGSVGSSWNAADEEDGIYCLDAETGGVKWFTHTPADVNRVLVSKGTVIAGCEDGSVVAVSARDGAQLWSRRLDTSVVGGPLKLPSNISSQVLSQLAEPRTPADPLLVTTYGGSVYLLDMRSGSELQRLDLGRESMAQPLLYRPNVYDFLAVPSLDGHLQLVEYSYIYLQLQTRAEVPVRYPDHYVSEGESAAQLTVEPVFAGGLIVQGLVRDTYFPEPPLVALDGQTGEFRWMASDEKQLVGSFGNLRGRPVVLDQEVLFAAAYSNALCALSLADGKLSWAVELGQEMFEQWCGPVVSGRSVYLGRHDGYLHKVNTVRRRREWSMYLGHSEVAGEAVSGTQRLPEFEDTAAWQSGGSAPIMATPALDSGRLYVGTYEGFLYCVANLGEDATE